MSVLCLINELTFVAKFLSSGFLTVSRLLAGYMLLLDSCCGFIDFQLVATYDGVNSLAYVCFSSCNGYTIS